MTPGGGEGAWDLGDGMSLATHSRKERMPDGIALPFSRVGVPVRAPRPRPPGGLQSAQRQCCFHATPSCSPANKNAVESVQYGVAGSAAFLECQPRSPQATVKWLFQRDPSDRRREVISCTPQSVPWMRGPPCSRSAMWVECSIGALLRQPHSKKALPSSPSLCGSHLGESSYMETLEFPYYMETTYKHASLHENSIHVLHWRYTSLHGNITRTSSSVWKFCGGALVLWKCVPGIRPYMEIL